jgi:hypothetical protein
MLTTGVIIATCILSIETALVANFLGTTNKAGLSAAAAFLFLFLAVFNLFLEGIAWYYPAEIFPTHLRAKGMTLSVIGFCVVDILWLEIAPTAIAEIGWKYYLVFISLSVPGAAILFFFYPDTLGKPLEEVCLCFGLRNILHHVLTFWDRLRRCLAMTTSLPSTSRISISIARNMRLLRRTIRRLRKSFQPSRSRHDATHRKGNWT